MNVSHSPAKTRFPQRLGYCLQPAVPPSSGVEADSMELLTINTHRGLFRFNCLPFGLKSAPAILHYECFRLRYRRRWATMLFAYDVSIKYQSTTNTGQADALCILMDSQPTTPEHAVIALITVEPEVSILLASTIRTLPVASSMVRDATANDPLLQGVIPLPSCTLASGVP
ncbi:uncharacterized protein DEA37_0001788 [Paragonimus westermani]|uniref:Uncharacterized protein n=1 Tax=Paragonimus westermani TaxID=34504 RepID=A0A5J4NKJ8_9TREM|nr:uncharacterized protein DEA37_0001788 [Paragonimus westermani]